MLKYMIAGNSGLSDPNSSCHHFLSIFPLPNMAMFADGGSGGGGGDCGCGGGGGVEAAPGPACGQHDSASLPLEGQFRNGCFKRLESGAQLSLGYGAEESLLNPCELPSKFSGKPKGHGSCRTTLPGALI